MDLITLPGSQIALKYFTKFEFIYFHFFEPPQPTGRTRQSRRTERFALEPQQPFTTTVTRGLLSQSLYRTTAGARFYVIFLVKRTSNVVFHRRRYRRTAANAIETEHANDSPPR